jgi:predicted nucleic acid-binding protein
MTVPELIYLDTCCLNRPFDAQTGERVRRETAAVRTVLDRVQQGQLHWVGSTALLVEIARRPGGPPEGLRELLRYMNRFVTVGAREEARARQLMPLGLNAMDALHLACAEHGGANVFLTTDDRLLRAARRVPRQVHVAVLNPVEWTGGTTS